MNYYWALCSQIKKNGKEVISACLPEFPTIPAVEAESLEVLIEILARNLFETARAATLVNRQLPEQQSYFQASKSFLKDHTHSFLQAIQCPSISYMPTKVNFTFPKYMNDLLTDYSTKLGLTKSAYLQMMLSYYWGIDKPNEK